MSLLHPVTAVGDRSHSLTVDRLFPSHHSMMDNTREQSSTTDKIESKFRTFRGWKRNIAYVEKSRTSHTVSLTHVSHSLNNTLP